MTILACPDAEAVAAAASDLRGLGVAPHVAADMVRTFGPDWCRANVDTVRAKITAGKAGPGLAVSVIRDNAAGFDPEAHAAEQADRERRRLANAERVEREAVERARAERAAAEHAAEFDRRWDQLRDIDDDQLGQLQRDAINAAIENAGTQVERSHFRRWFDADPRTHRQLAQLILAQPMACSLDTHAAEVAA